jgi:hypothetical protein
MPQLLDISFVYTQGKGATGLIYEIKRRADGLFYDFTNSVFSASPASQQAFLPETPANVFAISGSTGSTPSGVYEAAITLASLGAQFTDGDFKVYIWDIALAQMCGFGVVTITALDAAVVVPDNPSIQAGGLTTDGYEPRAIGAFILAMMANERAGFPISSGGGSATFKDPTGAENRVIPTYDRNGNITSVTYNPPS